MDDGAIGGTEEDVKRMVGNCQPDGSYDGTVTKILQTCGLKVKFIAVTGDRTPGAGEPLNGKVLGLVYSLAEDEFTFNVSMKFHLKGKLRQKQVVELGPEELQRIRSGERKFSRREALSFVAGSFDPLGQHYLQADCSSGDCMVIRQWTGTPTCQRRRRSSGWGGSWSWQTRLESP